MKCDFNVNHKLFNANYFLQKFNVALPSKLIKMQLQFILRIHSYRHFKHKTYSTISFCLRIVY